MALTIPETYQAWRRSTGDVPLYLQLVTENTLTSIRPNDVLSRVIAVSLNYRDVAILYGKYVSGSLERGILTSNCAAEVVKVRTSVTAFKISD